MKSLTQKLVMNDASVKLETSFSIDEIKDKYISYIIDKGFLFSVTKEELRENIDKNFIFDSANEEIGFSNGCDDILYGVLFQSFCIYENIEIINFEY